MARRGSSGLVVITAFVAAVWLTSCSTAEPEPSLDSSGVTACASSVLWASKIEVEDGVNPRVTARVSKWLRPTTGQAEVTINTDADQPTADAWRMASQSTDEILVLVLPDELIPASGRSATDYLRGLGTVTCAPER